MKTKDFERVIATGKVGFIDSHLPDLRKRHAKKLNNLLHTHSNFRWLDLLNKRTANCLNKRIYSHEASEADAAVCTNTAETVRTIIHNSAKPTDGTIVPDNP